jgi:hypothetical protein
MGPLNPNEVNKLAAERTRESRDKDKARRDAEQEYAAALAEAEQFALGVAKQFHSWATRNNIPTNWVEIPWAHRERKMGSRGWSLLKDGTVSAPHEGVRKTYYFRCWVVFEDGSIPKNSSGVSVTFMDILEREIGSARNTASYADTDLSGLAALRQALDFLKVLINRAIADFSREAGVPFS